MPGSIIKRRLTLILSTQCLIAWVHYNLAVSRWCSRRRGNFRWWRNRAAQSEALIHRTFKAINAFFAAQWPLSPFWASGTKFWHGNNVCSICLTSGRGRGEADAAFGKILALSALFQHISLWEVCKRSDAEAARHALAASHLQEYIIPSFASYTT